MQIQDISISGFRSLWNISINDLRQANIFYGENNCGKSNLLAALQVLFRVERAEEIDSPVAGFYRSDLTNFIDNFTIRNGSPTRVININAKIGLDDKDLSAVPVFAEFLRNLSILSSHRQWLQLEIEIIRVNDNTAIRITKKATINTHAMYDSSKPTLQQFFPGSTTKANQQTKQRAVEALFLYIMNSFEVISTGRFLKGEAIVETSLAAEGFKDWLHNLIESRGDTYTAFQTIQKWFQGNPFNYGTIRPVKAGGSTAILIKDDSDRELILERLGTGAQQILALLSAIATSRAKIIGIEELELNLSPSMQFLTFGILRQMINGSGDAKIGQLFLTSHSPYLCKREDAELYAISYNETNGTQVEHGLNAVRKLLTKHFDVGFFNISRRSTWRS
jgi:AAA15 family ATPase/GTPase